MRKWLWAILGLIGLAIVSGTMVLNQVRTLVAHLWENEGEAMTVTAQYLDSVNVPPPSLLPLGPSASRRAPPGSWWPPAG